jgi:hypothetical protein
MLPIVAEFAWRGRKKLSGTLARSHVMRPRLEQNMCIQCYCSSAEFVPAHLPSRGLGENTSPMLTKGLYRVRQANFLFCTECNMKKGS